MSNPRVPCHRMFLVKFILFVLTMRLVDCSLHRLKTDFFFLDAEFLVSGDAFVTNRSVFIGIRQVARGRCIGFAVNALTSRTSCLIVAEVYILRAVLGICIRLLIGLQIDDFLQ
jgi:hypothetical protein